MEAEQALLVLHEPKIHQCRLWNWLALGGSLVSKCRPHMASCIWCVCVCVFRSMPLANGWVVCSCGPLHSHSVMLDIERRWDHSGSRRVREQRHRIWSLKEQVPISLVPPDFSFLLYRVKKNAPVTSQSMFNIFLTIKLFWLKSLDDDILALGPRVKFTEKEFSLTDILCWGSCSRNSASGSLFSLSLLDRQDAEAWMCAFRWCWVLVWFCVFGCLESPSIVTLQQ